MSVGASDEVWVAILTTQDVVAAGLQAILQSVSAPFVVTTGRDEGEPDVVLYDVIKLAVEDGKDLDYWLTQAASTVIAIDRTLRPELGANARDRGVEWSIDLAIGAEELVAVIRDAVSGTLEDSAIARAWEPSDWPGQRDGLTRRESEVLQRIVVGRSNVEIADELYLTLNTVKSYIRGLYGKIDRRNRSQAVAWAIEHGFPTDRR